MASRRFDRTRLRNDIRLILKVCLREGLYQTDFDMDIVSNRLIDYISGDISIDMYKKKAYMEGLRAEHIF